MADRPGSTSATPQAHEAAPESRRKSPPLSPQIRDRLAMQLRSMYDTVATQPVPDRFAELIARLDTLDREPG